MFARCVRWRLSSGLLESPDGFSCSVFAPRRERSIRRDVDSDVLRWVSTGLGKFPECFGSSQVRLRCRNWAQTQTCNVKQAQARLVFSFSVFGRVFPQVRLIPEAQAKLCFLKQAQTMLAFSFSVYGGVFTQVRLIPEGCVGLGEFTEVSTCSVVFLKAQVRSGSPKQEHRLRCIGSEFTLFYDINSVKP